MELPIFLYKLIPRRKILVTNVCIINCSKLKTLLIDLAGFSLISAESPAIYDRKLFSPYVVLRFNMPLQTQKNKILIYWFSEVCTGI